MVDSAGGDAQQQSTGAQPWERIEPTIITKVGWRTIVSKTFRLPNGKVHHFETISPEGSAAGGCVALTPDNKIIVVKQFRPGRQRMMWEIPGGGVEPGEEPVQAAQRELLEEAGYIPGKIEPLGKYGGDAYTNSMWYYFLATDCVPSPDGQKLDATEFGEVCLISMISSRMPVQTT
jgi:ADP-ribose pyrophosphatase